MQFRMGLIPVKYWTRKSQSISISCFLTQKTNRRIIAIKFKKLFQNNNKKFKRH